MRYTDALRAEYERDGFFLDNVQHLMDNPEWKRDIQVAMDECPEAFAFDAQPGLVSTASAGIPEFMATVIDPQVLVVRQAANRAAEIYSEVRKGQFETTSALFPVVENTGVTTAYGDYEQGGSSNANINWEARQPYNFQTMIQYGDLAIKRAALAKFGLVSALQVAAAKALAKEENRIYFKGIQGLQLYGIQTDPNLLPAIAPCPKANGGFAWLVSGTIPNATPNEIFMDFQANVFNLINQSDGNIDTDSKFKAVMSPTRKGAITAANSFAVNTSKLIKDAFPNLEIIGVPQFGLLTAQNNQGVASEMFQVIATEPDGEETGWVAFNEKLRAHRLVAETSSFHQKYSSGVLGAVLRQLFAISTMTGI